MDLLAQLQQANATASGSAPPQGPNQAFEKLFEQKLASKASNALAALAGKEVTTPEMTTGIGHAVLHSEDTAVFDIDAHSATLPQLQGNVVTHVPSERPEIARKRIAVNDTYITYGLQKAQIRVMHRGNTSFRALLKYHEKPLLDLRFLENSNDLVSLDEAYQLVVWRLVCDDEEGKLEGTPIAICQVEHMLKESVQGRSIFVSGLPPDRIVLACDDRVLILRLAADQDDVSHALQEDRELRADSDVTCLASSDNAVAVGTSQGQVRLWYLPKSEEPFDGGLTQLPQDQPSEPQISSIHFTSEDGLLVGRASNTLLTLLRVHPGHISHAHTLRLESSQPMFNIAHHVPQSNLLLLANFLGDQLIAVLLSQQQDAFATVTIFDVTGSVYSMDVSAASEDKVLKIFTIQSKDIKELTLHTDHCQATEESLSTAPSVSALAARSTEAEHGSASGDLIDVSDTLSSALPVSSSTEAADQPARSASPRQPFTSRQASSDGQQQPGAEHLKSNIPHRLSGQALLQALQSKNAPSNRAGIAQPPAIPTSMAPRLPSANLLNQASQKALPRSDSGASSVVTEVDALQASNGAFARGLSTDGGLQSIIGRNTSAPDSSQGARSGSVANADGQQLPNGAKNEVTKSSTAQAARTGSEVRLNSPRVAAGQQAGATAGNGARALDQPLPPRPAASPTNGPQQGSGGGRESSLVIIERMQKASIKAMKQEILLLQKSQQEQFASFQKDLANQLSALKKEQEAQIAAILDRQKQELQEERERNAREQRENIAKLLTVISKDMNEQVPKQVVKHLGPKLQETSAGTSTNVQHAIKAALTKDLLGSNLQAALEKALASQLSQALAKPLQANFQSSFHKDVMPAFEAATQSMFAQVQSTFAGGLSEHLQAAGGVNASIASKLQEAIRDAKDVSAVLSQDVNAACRTLAEYATSIQQQAPVAPGQGRQSETDLQRHREEQIAEAKQLIAANKYQEAFNTVLNLGDIPSLVWLCSMVSPSTVLANNLLSQTTLLILLNQLAHELSMDTTIKLLWIKEIAGELEPKDPELAPHLENLITTAMQNLQNFKFDGQDAKLARHAVAVLQYVLSQVQTSPYL